MSDPGDPTAAEIIAGWAGLGAGKREMIAAVLMAAPTKDPWGQPSSEMIEITRKAATDPNAVENGVKAALHWADIIIKVSRDNPPS